MAVSLKKVLPPSWSSKTGDLNNQATGKKNHNAIFLSYDS